jgi:hypothetical protein
MTINFEYKRCQYKNVPKNKEENLLLTNFSVYLFMDIEGQYTFEFKQPSLVLTSTDSDFITITYTPLILHIIPAY